MEIQTVENGCELTRRSILSGETNTLFLPATPSKVYSWYTDGEITEHIQDFFPELDANQREFILTGITEQEWDNLYGEDDDEGY